MVKKQIAHYWRKMPNLLIETLEMLEEYDLNESDIKWVGNLKEKMSWENFKDRIKDINYNRIELEDDLIIVGDSWWIERFEYDGFYSWELKKHPIEPTTINNNLNILTEYCKKNLEKWSKNVIV